MPPSPSFSPSTYSPTLAGVLVGCRGRDWRGENNAVTPWTARAQGAAGREELVCGVMLRCRLGPLEIDKPPSFSCPVGMEPLEITVLASPQARASASSDRPTEG